MAVETKWTPVADQIVRDRWPDPAWSIKAIGLAVGCSRSTVQVRAKLLGLGPRPHGMNRATPRPDWERSHNRLRQGEPLLPVAGGEEYRGDTLSKLRPDWFQPCEPKPAQPGGPAKTCRWVTNNARPWLFCDAPSMGGYSYCPDHKEMMFRAFEPSQSAG